MRWQYLRQIDFHQCVLNQLFADENNRKLNAEFCETAALTLVWNKKNNQTTYVCIVLYILTSPNEMCPSPFQPSPKELYILYIIYLLDTRQNADALPYNMIS